MFLDNMEPWTRLHHAATMSSIYRTVIEKNSSFVELGTRKPTDSKGQLGFLFISRLQPLKTFQQNAISGSSPEATLVPIKKVVFILLFINMYCRRGVFTNHVELPKSLPKFQLVISESKERLDRNLIKQAIGRNFAPLRKFLRGNSHSCHKQGLFSKTRRWILCNLIKISHKSCRFSQKK